MLYRSKKKKQYMLSLRKHVNQPYIGVIETTMMYHSTEIPKEHLISVSTHKFQVNLISFFFLFFWYLFFF
jgi:hypothetical protein